MYLHNKKGLVLLSNVTMERVGRTCVQSVNRNIETASAVPFTSTNSPGRASLMVEACHCVDSGIGCEDDHHGGSGYTINGRHWGPVRIRMCTYRAGFDARLRAAIWNKTHDRSFPPFSGALVVDKGQACERSKFVKVTDNDFAIAPGCGDRALVQLQGADSIIFSNNTLRSGANENALDVDSLDHVNKTGCGFGCKSPPTGRGCLPPVDEDWMPPGALQYSCTNQANQLTRFRGKAIAQLCKDPCCKEKAIAERDALEAMQPGEIRRLRRLKAGFQE